MSAFDPKRTRIGPPSNSIWPYNLEKFLQTIFFAFGSWWAGGTDGQAANIPGLVWKTGEAAASADARSERYRTRRPLDGIL